MDNGHTAKCEQPAVPPSVSATSGGPTSVPQHSSCTWPVPFLANARGVCADALLWPCHCCMVQLLFGMWQLQKRSHGHYSSMPCPSLLVSPTLVHMIAEGSQGTTLCLCKQAFIACRQWVGSKSARCSPCTVLCATGFRSIQGAAMVQSLQWGLAMSQGLFVVTCRM